ncbi:MAG: pantoate--beta-alanine ligase [Phycisphaerae bacterium]|nr:pantoate--beta-alanine ligase [Phycisphaerae bacterium]
MIIAQTIAQVRQNITDARQKGKVIGLVPTMGGLHQGHYSLIRRCVEECDYTAVSIFVNPTQFAPGEDLKGYPRTFEADSEGCKDLDADLIFAPASEEIYPGQGTDPSDPLTWIHVEKVTSHLCGTSRPGHFRGVCTVVAKLFNIIQPDIAYFGQKDAQQLAVIRQMTKDLNFPIEIIGCPIVREKDGLAMSTRNKYLDSEQRKQALCLNKALKRAEEMIVAGQKNCQPVIDEMTKVIQQYPQAKVDYISIVDSDLLQPVTRIVPPVLIALAVQVGPARLIDNILVVPTDKKQ